MAKQPKKICIPFAQAKKLGLASAKKKTMAQLLRTDRGRKYAAVKKAFAREAKASSNTTCSLVNQAANKLTSHAESFAETFKGEGHLTAKQAKALVKSGAAAIKRARAVCSTLVKREKAATKRGAHVSSLNGRR